MTGLAQHIGLQRGTDNARASKTAAQVFQMLRTDGACTLLLSRACAVDGLCSSPGHWTAAAIYLQMLFVLAGHIAVTNLMGG
jgi:hypothetical protein